MNAMADKYADKAVQAEKGNDYDGAFTYALISIAHSLSALVKLMKRQ